MQKDPTPLMPTCHLEYTAPGAEPTKVTVTVPGTRLAKELRIAAVKNFDLDPEDFEIRTSTGARLLQFSCDVDPEGSVFTVLLKPENVKEQLTDLKNDAAKIMMEKKNFVTQELSGSAKKGAEQTVQIVRDCAKSALDVILKSEDDYFEPLAEKLKTVLSMLKLELYAPSSDTIRGVTTGTAQKVADLL